MTGDAGGYLGLLGDRDPIEVLSSTAAQLEEWLAHARPEELDEPAAPGGWIPREVIAHCADYELVVGFRLRQLLAVPGVELQPFEPAVWARRYQRLEPSLALEAFRSLRAWNLALLAGFGLEEWLAEAYHPERGFESADLMVRVLAGHDLENLSRLGIDRHGPGSRSPGR